MSRLVKPVPITLDKERSLLYDFNAECAVQQETGKDFAAFLPDVLNKETGALASAEDLKDFAKIRYRLKGPSQLRVLLWAGLLHEDESLTLKQAGKLLGFMGDREEVFGKILEALAAAFPSENPQPAEDPANQASPSA